MSAGNRRVAVLAPMRQELRPLLRPLALRRVHSDSNALFSGALGELQIVAAITGIGMRAGAQAAERVLDSGRVDHLVVVGIAGGIGSRVAIGDLVVPERVIDLASGAEHRPARTGDATPRGTLVTSDRLIVDAEEIAGLADGGAIAIDMETAAIAAVCERRGCAWSVFRAISDRAGDAAIDLDVLSLAGSDGRPELRALARYLLARPRRLFDLARLARGMTRATRVAASAALEALARA